MCLLKLEDGEISLINDITYLIMPYTILLHTWGEDNKEVNFDNLNNCFRKTKDRYEKLWFCEQQATYDGI
jgi:hypothetical protein